jgi:hypothetical protein
MRFADITYTGPPIDDLELLAELPTPLADLLRHTNGLIAFRGGLHLRGACTEPAWHSLRAAWRGPDSFAARYPAIRPSDIPFAQDCVGDQFLLREGQVFRLETESGEIEPFDAAFTEFLEAACADTIGYLLLQPLLQFEAEGGRLEPGQLLSVWPPFCAVESADGVSLSAISATERLGFLADLATQLAGMPAGTRFRIEMRPRP